MNIAIVILNWNGKHWLEKFLPSVVRFSESAQIVVIDNASTDDSVEFVKAQYPSIQLVFNQENHGFASGYNQGLQSVNADIYCLLNSDVEVTQNWLSPILELFQKDKNIVAIQPKILAFHQKDHFEFAGAAGGMIDNLGYPYCRGRVFDDIEKDNEQYNDETEIFWASGCAFFIRSKDFWEQNGFDGRFFAHQEEIDLCWRLKNTRKKIYYTSKSKVYHVGGGTLSKQSPNKTYLNFRNNLMMLQKNLPFPKLIALIFLRLCLDGIAGIYMGIKNGFPHLWAVVKAHFGFYKEIFRTQKLRGDHQIKKFYQTKWLIFKHFLK